jgi:hypothetical protein
MLAAAVRVGYLLFNQSSNCLTPLISIFPRTQKPSTQPLPPKYKQENENNMRPSLLLVLASTTVAFAAPLVDKRISECQISSNCTPNSDGKQCVLYRGLDGKAVFGTCQTQNILFNSGTLVIASSCYAHFSSRMLTFLLP